MNQKAKWIWHEGKYEINEYVDFVFDFEIGQVDQNAAFDISADSEYVLWINGAFAGCGQYDDDPNQKVYDTLYIGKYLQKGDNRIAVTAYYQGESSFQYAKGERGICYTLKNFAEYVVSSEAVRCRISTTYHSGEIHKTTSQLGFGFHYNAAFEDDWRSLDYVPDSKWSFSVVKDIQTKLKPRPIKKLIIEDAVEASITAQGIFKREDHHGTAAAVMYQDFLSHRPFEQILEGGKTFPVTIKTKTGDGAYIVVDLGKESCGYLNFVLSSNQGAVLDIAYGEHLQDLRVRSKIEDRNFANTYICKEGQQSFTHYFKRIAGRYIQVHISHFDHMSILYMGLKPATYPVTETGKFWCCDSLHNKIFDVCVETLKLCMHEHYEDCPWREQALYSLDSRNQALFGYYAFGEYEFAKASIELLGQSLRKDGQLNICAPTDATITIPSFSLFWILAVKEYTEFSGDLYFVNQYWDHIESIIKTCTSTMKHGLVSPPMGEIYWHFYEWAEGYDGFDESYKKMREHPDFLDGVYQLIAYIAVKESIWLAKKANQAAFIKEASDILFKMGAAFRSVFWNEEKQVYASYKLNNELMHYGEFTQALALYAQICDQQQGDLLCSALAQGKGLVTITLGNAIFKYEALLRHDKKYAKLVFEDIAEKWGHMLYGGATSFWETLRGEADFNHAGSLCHGWSATPLYLYLRYISGITPQGKTEPIKDVFAQFNGEAQMRHSKICVQSDKRVLDGMK